VPAVFDAGGDSMLGPADADDEVDDRTRAAGLEAPGLDLHDVENRSRPDFRGEFGVDTGPGRAGVGLREDGLGPLRSGDHDLLDVADDDVLLCFRLWLLRRTRGLGIVESVGEPLDGFLVDAPAGPLDGEFGDVGGGADAAGFEQSAEPGGGVHFEHVVAVVALDDIDAGVVQADSVDRIERDFPDPLGEFARHILDITAQCNVRPPLAFGRVAVHRADDPVADDVDAEVVMALLVVFHVLL